MKIVDYRTNNDLDIEFQDEYHYIKEHNTYSNFKSGSVKNPYDKTICNVGFIGNGKYQSQINGKYVLEYSIWEAMIARCYRKSQETMYPAYFGECIVCHEWHNYQTFAKWYNDNYYEVDGRLHMDKDILFPGNKEYSPNKCILVPQRINLLFMNKSNNRGLPQGIRKTTTDRYSVVYGGKNLGICKTYEEACDRYEIAKKNKIVKVANEYKDKIPQKLYDALINYNVKIENFKNYVA